MRFDHHQEETHRRWKGASNADYDPGYEPRPVKDSDPQPRRKGFWLWIWVNPTRFSHLIVILCLYGLTAIAFLQVEGVLDSTLLSESGLIILSTVLGILSISWTAGMAIAWRKYKYSQTE